MFQRKIDRLFSDIPNVLGIADDILIASFEADGKQHDASLEKVLWRCIQANLKLNREKCLFRQTCISFLHEVISRHSMNPDMANVKALADMPPPKTKRQLKSFLDIVTYLSKFSPITAAICKPLRRLTSVNAAWMWNTSYKEIYETQITGERRHLHEVL